VWFDKPADISGARNHLVTLRGKTHVLPTAVCVALNGARIWHHVATPRLTVRSYSDAFIDDYLKIAGTAVLSSVGAYQLEGLGAQLFSKIEGDFFTILGLPLLPLLAFLREHEVAPQ
jgi:septum formation protein